MGLDRAHYGNLARADKVPMLPTMWKLADVLDTTPSKQLSKAERLVGKS